MNANEAVSGAMAKSQAATRPRPPARAVPFSRQMTGFGLSQISDRTSGNDAVTGASPRCSFRSAPEQNTGPVPVSTITRASGSASACSRLSARSPSRRTDSALRFGGESSVIVAIPSASSLWTRRVMRPPPQ